MLVVPVWPPTATAAPVGLNSRLRTDRSVAFLHTPGRARRREEPQPAVDRPERDRPSAVAATAAGKAAPGRVAVPPPSASESCTLPFTSTVKTRSGSHEELRGTQGAAALALGRYRLSLLHRSGNDSQICARDRFAIDDD